MKNGKKQKRKNYYQVHLNKKPKMVKRYTRKRKYTTSELIDLLASGFKKLNRVFKKGSIAAKKLNIALGVSPIFAAAKSIGIDIASGSDKTGYALAMPNGEVIPIKNPIGLSEDYPQQEEIIMRKDGSVIKMEKNYTSRGKITGQHAHLLPVWNPDLYPMPTDQDAINAIERSLDKIGFKTNK